MSKTASERGRAARRKGKAGELEVAKLFCDAGVPARRGQQYAGDPDAPDVVLSPEYREYLHVEVKRTEKLKMTQWLQQLEEDNDGGDGVIFHRRNAEDWNVIMPADFFLKMFKAYADQKLSEGLEF